MSVYCLNKAEMKTGHPAGTLTGAVFGETRMLPILLDNLSIYFKV